MEDLNIFKDPNDGKELKINSVFLLYRLRYWLKNGGKSRILGSLSKEQLMLIITGTSVEAVYNKMNPIIREGFDEAMSLAKKYYNYKLGELI